MKNTFIGIAILISAFMIVISNVVINLKPNNQRYVYYNNQSILYRYDPEANTVERRVPKNKKWFLEHVVK